MDSLDSEMCKTANLRTDTAKKKTNKTKNQSPMVTVNEYNGRRKTKQKMCRILEMINYINNSCLL